MIENMTMVLQVSTRKEAVQYFISHNSDELHVAIEKTFNLTSDPVAAILMSHSVRLVDAGMVAPIVNLVSEYLDLLYQPCLQSYLPSYFEDRQNYAEMFTPLDRSSYRVSRKDLGRGIDGVLHDEGIEAPYTKVELSTWNTSVISILRIPTRFGYFNDGPKNHSRLVDLRAGCAVDVNPLYSHASVIPGRLFSAWDQSARQQMLWRGDVELSIDVIDTSDETASSHPPQLFLTVNDSFLTVEVLNEPTSMWLTLPINPDEPFEPRQLGVIDHTFEMKPPRFFDDWLTNRCIDDLVLFNRNVEHLVTRLEVTFINHSPREILSRCSPDSRVALELMIGGRHLAAWRVMRTIPIDEMTRLIRN